MFTTIKYLTKKFIPSEPLADKGLNVKETRDFEEEDFYFEITSDLDFDDESFNDETTTKSENDAKDSVHNNIVYENNKNTKEILYSTTSPQLTNQLKNYQSIKS